MRCIGILKTLVLILTLSTSPALVAADNLDTWLRHEAGPALVSLISQEPRFLGEAISFAALKADRPAPFDDALSIRIRDSLRQLMLDSRGIRIPLEPTDSCTVARHPIVLVIGISETSRGQHQIQLALLDVEDRLWINGSSQLWFGRLTNEQTALLATRAGTDTYSFGLNDTEAIASSLDAQLDCHPELPQPVYLAAEDNALKLQLLEKLGARFLLTDQPELALSQLRLNSTGELLTLALVGQTVSSPLAEVRLRQSDAAAYLLTEIALSKNRSTCRGHGPACVDLVVKAAEPAYLFEFITMSGRLVPLQCGVVPARTSGEVRQSLKIPDGERAERPALGYYVLATTRPGVARQLADTLRGEYCGGNHDDGQLQALAGLVSSEGVAWRSIHFDNNRGRINTPWRTP